MALLAKDYRAHTSGVAFALGEAPPKALVEVGAMVRLALGEALTNLVFGNVTRWEDIHFLLSLNCAGKVAGGTARLYAACQAASHALHSLGLTLLNVKDSVAMAVHLRDETVQVGVSWEFHEAPLTLIATAVANAEDVADHVTPAIRHASRGSRLLLLDLGATPAPALGGSALAQVFDQLGDQVPDVDLALLRRAFLAVQALIKQGHILAGHDRSDGGLLTTLLEMCFAGYCGADIEIPAGIDPTAFLFHEALGWVLEVDEALCEPLLRSLQDSAIPAVLLGTTHSERVVRVGAAAASSADSAGRETPPGRNDRRAARGVGADLAGAGKVVLQP